MTVIWQTYKNELNKQKKKINTTSLMQRNMGYYEINNMKKKK